MLTIILPARLSNLDKFVTPVSDWLRSQGLSQPQTFKIELALEEALVNVCRYAYRQEEGLVEVRCQGMDDHRYMIEIIDSGIPFDVCAYPTPELNVCVADRKIGGLGVHLMRRMVDQITYRREGNQNILGLLFRTMPDRNAGTAPCQYRA
jgi:serine/threonine-protein kinase RsbW